MPPSVRVWSELRSVMVCPIQIMIFPCAVPPAPDIFWPRQPLSLPPYHCAVCVCTVWPSQFDTPPPPSNGSNQVTKVIGDPTSHGAQFLPSSASVRSAAVVSFAPLSPLPQPSIVPLHPNFDSEAANRIKPLSCGLYPLACPCPRCLSLSIPYKPLEQILIILSPLQNLTMILISSRRTS